MATPKKNGLKRKANMPLSALKKKGGKIIRQLTPPRNARIGLASSQDVTKLSSRYRNVTLSTQFSNADEYNLKTSELEPSAFQLEIPKLKTILSHCKICDIVDNYTEVAGIDFDLSSLMPWVEKNTVVRKSLENEDSKFLNAKNLVLNALQGAASDIIVEGFFRHYTSEEGKLAGTGRVEACVFSSHKLRQFIVCYRGSSNVQNKPVHQKEIFSNIQDENKRGLNPPIIKKISHAYDSKLERDVFALLKRLSALKPFCDVVMIGHSFGAALATLGSTKYASLHPMMRVSCHVFGSPKVAGSSFRREVHGLPNLKVIRIERETDPFILLPEGSNFCHVGHCIRINHAVFNAYRFDKYRPTTNFVKNGLNTLINLTKLQIGNEIRLYTKDLENLPNSCNDCASKFVGENGFGVHGKDQECRFIV